VEQQDRLAAAALDIVQAHPVDIDEAARRRMLALDLPHARAHEEARRRQAAHSQPTRAQDGTRAGAACERPEVMSCMPAHPMKDNGPAAASPVPGAADG
jgi:hypothetical protein